MPSPQPENPFLEANPSKTLIFTQDSFAGGLNQQVDPTRLQNNEYPLLVNGRTRYGVVEPVLLPANADPQGSLSGMNIQGVYSAGPFLLVFADGKAYYRNVLLPLAAFTLVTGGFTLNPLATTVWAEQIPASFMNFGRTLVEPDNILGGVKLFGSVNGSPQCVIAQDGESQPWLVFEDGTSRLAQTYEQWNLDQREYVPVGSMMMYLNGILYIVGDKMFQSTTLKRRQIFRSVTGRPLDFVVNIAPSGGKGGDASTTSYNIDYDEITSIRRMNSNNGSFFLSSAKNSYLVLPVLDALAGFNEPRFTNTPLFNTGPLNQFSMADKIGDACFIDFGGIRSFNAVLQDRNEGRNLPFSKKVALLFTTLIQEATAAISYDDYVFFSVNTIYGYAILVYDTIQECWIGLDIPDNFQEGEVVLQFCEVKIGVTRRLFCRTSANRIFELFAGTTYATVRLYIGEWCSNDPKVEEQPNVVKFVFSNLETAGDISITPFVDGKSYVVLAENLQATTVPFVTPLQFPFGDATQDVVRNINVSLSGVVDNGWKVGFLIQWAFAAELTHILAECDKIATKESSDEQAASLYNT